MAAQPTKVYPLQGVYAVGIPHVVTVAESKAEAEALEATGAFTTNANHPDRIRDTDEPVAPTEEK